MLRIVSSLVMAVSLACCGDHGALDLRGSLPQALEEVSGLEYDPTSRSLFAINDSGHPPDLYVLSSTDGSARSIHRLPDTRNTDWEDLALGPDGTLYIADFGNNGNNRKDLAIYIFKEPLAGNGPTGVINFWYPDQKGYPPEKKDLHYDAEGLVFYEDQLLIFTKDRSTPFNGQCRVYSIPARAGEYPAQFKGTIGLWGDKKEAMVTGADYDPDSGRLLLLAETTLWVLDGFTPESLEELTPRPVPLGMDSQKESVCFGPDGQILIADEQRSVTGGNLYSLKLEQ